MPRNQELTVRQKHLVRRNLPLARHILRLLVRRSAKLESLLVADPDRVQAAADYGLVLAAQLFDPQRGFRFSTYAALCVRRQVMAELAQGYAPVRIPPCAWDSPRTMPYAESAQVRFSLDYRQLEDGMTVGELLPTPEPPEPPDLAGLPQVLAALERLEEPYQTTVRLRFWEGLTLQEIGQHTGVTREGARLRLEKAMRDIRNLVRR